MAINKTKSIRSILGILFFVIVMVVTMVILYSVSNKTNDPTDPESTSIQADTLMTEAINAAKNNETTKAKELLRQARNIYVDTKNLDGVANTDAQLYLIDHPR